MENAFLFHLKRSFLFHDIQIFVFQFSRHFSLLAIGLDDDENKS